MVADHQRRAPARCARRAGVVDLSAFAIFDIVGPGALETRAARRASRSATCARRPGDLHPGARRQGRLPLRPDRDAAGRRPLPRGHRRRARHGRPEVVRRPRCPTAAPRSSTRPRRSPRSACGARGPATSSAALTDDDVSARGLRRSCTCREIEVGRRRGARLADLLRRRARLGALRPDGAGRAGCGTRCSRRARPHGAVPVGIGVYGTTGRHREGLPRLRLRARRRAHDRRGRHAAAQGQGRRLRRPGGLPRAARGGARRRCSAR